MFVAVKREVLFRLLVFVADDAVGGGELRHHEAAAAKVANEAAKDRVGDAGHGSEHSCRPDFDVADRNGWRHARASGRNALGRVVVRTCAQDDCK